MAVLMVDSLSECCKVCKNSFYIEFNQIQHSIKDMIICEDTVYFYYYLIMYRV